MTDAVVITIGGKYAETLGYEQAVDSMGIINDVMSALVEVQVLCGPAIGRKFDVHKEDITVLAAEQDDERYLIADYDSDRCYFTNSKELYNFILESFDYGQGYRAYGKASLQDNILFYRRFTFHDADSPLDKVTKIFRDTFDSMEVQ